MTCASSANTRVCGRFKALRFFVCRTREKEMYELPDDVLLEIISRSSTLELSRLASTSKLLARVVYQHLSIKYIKSFTSMMKSITCTRTPSLKLLLRYSAPDALTNKLRGVRYICAHCGRKIHDIALCNACQARGPRPLTARRVMTRSQTRQTPFF